MLFKPCLDAFFDQRVLRCNLASVVLVSLFLCKRFRRDGNSAGSDANVNCLAIFAGRGDFGRSMGLAGGRTVNQAGNFNPARCISLATFTISSSDGMISPDKLMATAFSSKAVCKIFPAGTITPRSMIS